MIRSLTIVAIRAFLDAIISGVVSPSGIVALTSALCTVISKCNAVVASVHDIMPYVELWPLHYPYGSLLLHYFIAGFA